MKKIKPRTALIVSYSILAAAAVFCFLNPTSNAFLTAQLIVAAVALVSAAAVRLLLCRCPHCGRILSLSNLLQSEGRCPRCGKRTD